MLPNKHLAVLRHGKGLKTSFMRYKWVAKELLVYQQKQRFESIEAPSWEVCPHLPMSVKGCFQSP
jgi:hypothetical protein